MVAETHVVSETKTSDNPRKLQRSILDNFAKLSKDKEKLRLKSGIALVKYLTNCKNNENGELEVKYALKRLIRGLGSPRINARKGFYSTLVALLTTNDITLNQVLEIVGLELKTSGSDSKSEKGEIYTSQVLVCGAVLRSGIFFKGSKEEQAKIIHMLINAGERRSYLSLASYTFLTDFLEHLDVKQFRKLVLPQVTSVLTKPWIEQTLNNLYLFLTLQARFPDDVNGKFLKICLGTSEIICNDTLGHLCDLLITPVLENLQHPVYVIFATVLSTSAHLLSFYEAMNSCLIRPNQSRLIAVTKITRNVVQNIADSSKIPDLVTENYLRRTLEYFRGLTLNTKNDEYQKELHQLFDVMVNRLKLENDSDVKIALLKKFLFYPGTFMFEKKTKSKVVQQITLLLNSDGVKQLAELYKKVILAREKKENDNETWWNNDRVYAAQLLVKLFGHQAVQSENDWKVEQLKFLASLSIFKLEEFSNVGSELASTLRETFFRGLDHKLQKLEDLRSVLSKVLHYVNTAITPENYTNILRNPFDEEIFSIWKKTVELVKKLENNNLKKKGVESVFHILFLQIGLQLFNDVNLAKDSLKELFSCYERIKKNKGQEEERTSDDPLWIEVVTDLFLNLLSHNSHLLRSLVGCVFPHLCPYLNSTAVHQILAVFDAKNEDNPLMEVDGESSESGDESDDSEEEEDNEEGESSEQEDDNETVSDKLRMAVRQALGGTGYQTDEESISIDDISESEGKKLDEALVQAFKQIKPNLGRRKKKQSKEDETLTHFRVRVLDLIEIYLDNSPSMLLCLEIMLPLLQMLEFCIRDVHQKPLLDRVRFVLKKLSNVKKFGSTEDVTDVVLSDLLKSLLERGTKNSLIVQDMGDKLAECCVFILRCSQVLLSSEETPKEIHKHLKHTIGDIILEELEIFFTKNNSLTPYVLFKGVLSLNWRGNLVLIDALLNFAFEESIRPFRRCQAVELLTIFLSSRRDVTEIGLDDFRVKFSAKIVDFLQNTGTATQKFASNLFNLLNVMKKCSGEDTAQIDWKKIGTLVMEYQSQAVLSTDGKTAYKKLCRSLGILGSVKPREKPGEEEKKAEESEDTVIEKPQKKKIKPKTTIDKKKLKKERKLLQLKSSSEGLEEKKKAEESEDTVIEKPKTTNDKKKLKKERKLLRLKSSSEGLEDGFTFINVNGLDNEVENKTESKKDFKRRSYDVKQQSNGETAKKKRKPNNNSE